MPITDSKTITTEQAQKSANFCSGENAPNLYTINADNWIHERNKFLSNVAYNGARSHNHIITVLVWFSQFNTEE